MGRPTVASNLASKIASDLQESDSIRDARE
jgi:hypothetical protein